MTNSLTAFLLNSDPDKPEVVEAPAFSLTKVLGAGAVIITPIATVLIEAFQKETDFKGSDYVTLAIGLLGFLAITAAADVLARAIVTAAEKRSEAADKQTAAAVKQAEAEKKQAEAAQKKADAAVKGADAVRVQAAASAARLVPFDTPIPAHHVLPGADAAVKVLAAAGADEPYLLVQDEDGKIAWLLAKDVKIGSAG